MFSMVLEFEGVFAQFSSQLYFCKMNVVVLWFQVSGRKSVPLNDKGIVSGSSPV